MRAPLELERTVAADATTIRVVGELDCHTSPLLADLVESSERDAPARLLLDLTGCTFLDSGGCRVLAVAHRLVGDGRIGVVCPAANTAVRRVLDIVGLADALDVREARADFGRPSLGEQPA